MHALDLLAEQRIAEAERDGLFRDLPGAGAPLVLDDDQLIPAELRMAYRILKNAGYVPPEVTALRELAELEALVRRTEGDARTLASRKLDLLRIRIEAIAPRRAALIPFHEYGDRLIERFAGRHSTGD